MNSKQEKAIQTFRSGYNCAQSVLKAFLDDFDADVKTTLLLTTGFGAGMGRLQKTCGAVTGSFMVLGLYNAKTFTTNEERNEKIQSMIQDFHRQFVIRYHTTDCKQLLNCDLNTEEGQKYASKHNLFETTCEDCVSQSVKILEEMME